MTRLESVPLEGGRALEDLTIREIARVMVKVQGLRRAKVEELENLAVSPAKARKDATMTHARAFLSHEGPQEERTQTAKLDACKAAMEILKDDWDTCRSIGANERAQQSATEGFGA